MDCPESARVLKCKSIAQRDFGFLLVIGSVFANRMITCRLGHDPDYRIR